MTEDQKKEMKIFAYTHWRVCKELDTDTGIRDIEALKNVVTMPGGGSLTCLLGQKLTNKKDLYSQIGWLVYYTLEGEPLNSKNKATIVLAISWILEHYNIDYDLEQIGDYIENLDIMNKGNADISAWFSKELE